MLTHRSYRILATTTASLALIAATGCPAPGNGNGNNNDNDNGGLDTFRTPTRSSTIALTSDDRFALVSNIDADSVSLVEVRNAQGGDASDLIVEIGVGDEPRGVAIMPDDATAFVCNTASGTVSVISLKGDDAFQVIREIEVGTEPRWCALTPNGTRLYVANHTQGTVSVINTSTLAVIDTVDLGGNPTAIAITNDGDTTDTDETVFVTRFYAELKSGGSEAFDDGKEAFVHAFTVGNRDVVAGITLSPVANSGFNADRKNFCKQINAAAAFDTFCPDVTILDGTNDIIDNDPQAVFPNQLYAAIVRGNRLFLPNIGASPEPPLKFNINVQSLVHVVNVTELEEVAGETLNLNNQIKAETQPAVAIETTVLDRLFGGDIVAVDSNINGDEYLFCSRGGNYILRANLDASGLLTINAPNDVVRIRTGNLPNGIVMSSDSKRAYTNNEVGHSITAINLENNGILNLDIATAEPPVPGTFDHAVLVGKLCFFSALGVPDNGIFDKPIRNIIPLESRNKMSDNSWSSCGSCHPDGWSDHVTWIFATGPRNTIALDAFFAKDNPADQRISNWNAVRSSVTDFNENSVAVQGGKGFAGTPPNPNVYNHGLSQGVSDALDAQTLWVQTIRPPILPDGDSAVVERGRTAFGTNCASCHGGAKWTKSQVVYADNPAFLSDPNAGGAPRDTGITNAAAQIRAYTAGGATITLMENVNTFVATDPIEIRNNATLALGGLGFNVPSLLGIAYHAPYLHHGKAQTLEDVFRVHLLGAGTIESTLNAQQRADLIAFLKTIDGATPTFDSQTDAFLEAIGG